MALRRGRLALSSRLNPHPGHRASCWHPGLKSTTGATLGLKSLGLPPALMGLPTESRLALHPAPNSGGPTCSLGMEPPLFSLQQLQGTPAASQFSAIFKVHPGSLHVTWKPRDPCGCSPGPCLSDPSTHRCISFLLCLSSVDAKASARWSLSSILKGCRR